jgi:hypothetical protein
MGYLWSRSLLLEINAINFLYTLKKDAVAHLIL